MNSWSHVSTRPNHKSGIDRASPFSAHARTGNQISLTQMFSKRALAMMPLLTNIEIAFGNYRCLRLGGCTVTRPEAISALTDSCIDSRLENRGLYPRR